MASAQDPPAHALLGHALERRAVSGIERRGQSSQRFPKVSFAIELRDARGRDRRTPLLGLPADGDWVLYAPYNDKTLMRNVVAYDTARAIGRYASATPFVELHLNGRYHGVYVLMEKLELGSERVQGTALLEFTFPFQARSKGTSFRTPVKRRPIVWEDPERSDLTDGRAEAIARRVRVAERTLYGPGDWRRSIDEDSAVDFVLLNELFRNEDGFHASIFLALHPDGRLRLGPIWDFDISMGNSDYGPSRRLEGWMLVRRDWAERLYRDRAFTRAMAARWRCARMGSATRCSRRSRATAGRLMASWCATSGGGRSWTDASGPTREPLAPMARGCASCARGCAGASRGSIGTSAACEPRQFGDGAPASPGAGAAGHMRRVSWSPHSCLTSGP